MGITTVPDRVPERSHPDWSAELGTSADESKSDGKSTSVSSAVELLRGVRDSAIAFGPLKSIAGDLCFILEICEV